MVTDITYKYKIRMGVDTPIHPILNRYMFRLHNRPQMSIHEVYTHISSRALSKEELSNMVAGSIDIQLHEDNVYIKKQKEIKSQFIFKL